MSQRRNSITPDSTNSNYSQNEDVSINSIKKSITIILKIVSIKANKVNRY